MASCVSRVMLTLTVLLLIGALVATFFIIEMVANAEHQRLVDDDYFAKNVDLEYTIETNPDMFDEDYHNNLERLGFDTVNYNEKEAAANVENTLRTFEQEFIAEEQHAGTATGRRATQNQVQRYSDGRAADIVQASDAKMSGGTATGLFMGATMPTAAFIAFHYRKATWTRNIALLILVTALIVGILGLTADNNSVFFLRYTRYFMVFGCVALLGLCFIGATCTFDEEAVKAEIEAEIKAIEDQLKANEYAYDSDDSSEMSECERIKAENAWMEEQLTLLKEEYENPALRAGFCGSKRTPNTRRPKTLGSHLRRLLIITHA